jgi:hypothetical protein
MNEDFLSKEYFALLELVKDFDRQLITIKGWGVTLSLAALGFGFQYAHYGLFLVAALSGFAFWVVEGLVKRYQIRYYMRIRDIEVFAYEQHLAGKSIGIASPQIDWSFDLADQILRGESIDRNTKPPVRGSFPQYRFAWFMPNVISLIAGLILFILALLRIIPFPL